MRTYPSFFNDSSEGASTVGVESEQAESVNIITRIEKIMARINIPPLFFIFIAFLLFSSNAWADGAPNQDIIERITQNFVPAAQEIGKKLEVYAVRLFSLFLILDIALLGIRVSLNRDQIQDTIKHFIMILLFAGFVLAVIHNYQQWTNYIINGLLKIGTEVGGENIVESPFLIGIRIIMKITDKISGWQPIDALALTITAIVLMVCFALMAAQIIIINAESYIALNAAVILLGFGGCGMMKEYAINAMRYCLSVAFKLFVLQLIMGISMRIIEGFAVTGTEAIDLVTLIGSAVVVLALIKSLPDIAAGIINGAHVGGNSLISTGMAAGAAMFGGAVGAGMGAQAAGGGAANLLRANKLANMEGATGLGKVGHMAGSLLKARQQAADQKSPSMGTRLRDRIEAAAMKDKKGE